MNFDHIFPLYLVVFVGAALVMLFLVYRSLRSTRLPFFRPLEFALKAIAVLMLCLALARPYLKESFNQDSALLLLDVSKSMDQGTTERLLGRVRELGKQGLEVAVLLFAAQSSNFVQRLNDLGSFTESQRAFSKLNYSATSIPAALQALSSFGASNVLLISDGYSNQGDLGRSMAELGNGRFTIFPLTEPQAREQNGFFGIANLYAPMIAPTGKSVEVRVAIKNSTAKVQSGRIEVYHDNKQLLSRSVRVEPGRDALESIPSDPALDGIREIKATFVPDDSSLPSSSETIYLSSRERDKVLLLNGADEDARVLEQVLKTQAFKLESLNAANGLDTLPSFEGFSAVVFNNVARKQLPSSAPILIEKYVKAGGGFVMIGGARSFGLGGYKDTDIESVLPVTLTPPQTQQKRLNVAVELVLDKSRSMGDGERIEFAKEAAREVIRQLKDDDLVGVIGFDSVPFEVVRLAELSATRDQALERVGRLFPNGKTNLLPAIDEARRRLESAAAGRKHMIILTDGQLPDGGPYYVELVKQMRLVGITVSTVLLSSESDMGLLQAMGDAGGGAFYQTADPRSLPRIFISDIKVSSGEKTLKEQQEYLVRAGPSGTQSTSIKNFPPLRGYVQTSAKPAANLELVAFGGDRAEPLLASWTYGKGRSIAFTSDANGRWSNYWVEWPRFQPFWSEVLESLKPQSGKQGEEMRYDLRYFVEDGNLALDLSLYGTDGSSELTTQLELPSGKTITPVFTQISRGHFKALLESPEAGKYTFRGSAASQRLTPVAFKLPDELFGEKNWQGFNTEVLAKLASLSGGKINPKVEELKNATLRSSVKYPLENWILFAALILLLAEIVKREIFPRLSSFSRRAKALQ